MANKNHNYIYGAVYTEYCDYNHKYCKNIKSLVKKFINKNENIPENLLIRYICCVCSNIVCWSLEYEDNLILCNDIINKRDSIENIFKKFCMSEIYNFELFEILLNKIDKEILVKTIIDNRYIDINTLIKIINRLFDMKYDTKKLLIISVYNKLFTCINNIIDSKFDLSSNFNHVNEDIFADELINYDYDYDYDNDNDVNIYFKKFNNRNYLFDYILYSLYFDKDYNDKIELIKKCVLNGCIIQKNTLKKFVINTQNYLKNNKYIKISNDFDNICEYLLNNGSTDINISDFIDYNTIQNFTKFCNMIVEHKNSITLDEFKKVTQRKVKINNISLIKDYLNIAEVKNLIYSNKINYGIKIDLNINILQQECLKKNNIGVIKDILKTIKPDIVCLENACKSQDINTIKLLHDVYKIDFNDKCILNYAEFINDHILQRLLNIYKHNNPVNLENK